MAAICLRLNEVKLPVKQKHFHYMTLWWRRYCADKLSLWFIDIISNKLILEEKSIIRKMQAAFVM